MVNGKKYLLHTKKRGDSKRHCRVLLPNHAAPSFYLLPLLCCLGTRSLCGLRNWFLNSYCREIPLLAASWCSQCEVHFNHQDDTFLFSSVAPCSSIMLNCSQPDPPSLLDALRPVFNLGTIRPVMNLSTPTNVSINFILFGILGVVRDTTYI